MGDITAMFLAAVVSIVCVLVVFAVVFLVDSSQGASPTNPQSNEIQLDSTLVSQGRVLFTRTCITCHTAAGDAVPNLGVSLKTSTRVASMSTDELAAFVKAGSLPGMTQNQTGMSMPPNPSMKENQLQALAAYVKSLQQH